MPETIGRYNEFMNLLTSKRISISISISISTLLAVWWGPIAALAQESPIRADSIAIEKLFTESVGVSPANSFSNELNRAFDAFHSADTNEKKMCYAAQDALPSHDWKESIEKIKKGVEVQYACGANKDCKTPPVMMVERQFVAAPESQLQSSLTKDNAGVMAQIYSSHLRSPQGKLAENSDTWHYWEYDDPDHLDRGASKYSTSTLDSNSNPPKPMELNKKTVITKCYSLKRFFAHNFICNTIQYRLTKISENPMTYALVSHLVEFDSNAEKNILLELTKTSGLPPHKWEDFRNVFSKRSSVAIFKSTPQGAVMFELGKTPFTSTGEVSTLNRFGTKKIIETLVLADHDQFLKRLNLESSVPPSLGCLKQWNQQSWDPKNRQTEKTSVPVHSGRLPSSR